MPKQDNEEGGSNRSGAAVDPVEFVDQLVKGPLSAEKVNAVSMAFKKALIGRPA